MERIFLSSSLKDIPIPKRDVYVKLLISKVNSFIRRLRWKVFHADKANKLSIEDKSSQMKRKFRSMKKPPFKHLLIEFLSILNMH